MSEADASVERALDAVRRESLHGANAMPIAELRAVFTRVATWRRPDRAAEWAEFFRARNDATYVFGDAPGGYVHEGRLIDDRTTDCVLFLTRVVELASASSPEEAVDRALDLRFPDAPLTSLFRHGKLDFGHPSRLRYGEDMITSGGYGAVVTSDMGDLEPDPGTTRYPSGTIAFVPSDRVDLAPFRNGDLVFFVLSPRHEAARSVRETTGATIGHMGIVRTPGDHPLLVHAALSALPGAYEGNRIVVVPLVDYLRRVDRFAGIVVTRLSEWAERPRAAPSSNEEPA